MTEQTQEKVKKKKVIMAVGKRKKAQARAFISEGTGRIMINSKPIDFVQPRYAQMRLKEPVVIAGDAANKVNITIKAPTAEITFNIETINVSGNVLNINGWAFLQGNSTDMSKSFILLKKNDTVSVFTTGVMFRKDITDFFKETKLRGLLVNWFY